MGSKAKGEQAAGPREEYAVVVRVRDGGPGRAVGNTICLWDVITRLEIPRDCTPHGQTDSGSLTRKPPSRPGSSLWLTEVSICDCGQDSQAPGAVAMSFPTAPGLGS